MVLSLWLFNVNSLFSPGHLPQDNSFSDRIPVKWYHIFETGFTFPRRLARDFPGGVGRHGDPDDANFRKFAYKLFEKVRNHANSICRHNKHFIVALNHFPTVLNDQDERVEICFNATFKRIRYLTQRTCTKIHLYIRDWLYSAPRDALRNVRSWLNRRSVKARIQLTSESKDFANLHYGFPQSHRHPHSHTTAILPLDYFRIIHLSNNLIFVTCVSHRFL